MELYGLLAASILTMSMGFMSLFRRRRDHTAHYFFLTMLGTSLWALGIAIFLMTSRELTAMYAAALYYSAAALIAYATLLMGMSLFKGRSVPVSAMLLLAIPFGGIVVTLFGVPHVFMSDIHLMADEANSITLATLPYTAYGIYFIVYFGVGIIAMIRAALAARRKSHRARLRYIASAYAIAGLIGVWFNLILPWLGDYNYIWVGPLGLLLFVPIVYVAIIKYGLFDIKLAVSRTVAYTLTLGLLASVYVVVTGAASEWLIRRTLLPEWFVSSPDTSFVGVMLTLGLVFLFQPVKRFFDRVTHSIFYRNIYKRDVFYAEVSDILVSTTSLRPLLERVSGLFVRTFGASQAFFFVYRDSRYTTAGSPGYARLPVKDARWLDEVIADRPPEAVPITEDQLLDTEQDVQLRRFMVSHQIAAIVPLTQSETTVGYLCLGEQQRGSYSVRDRQVLRAVSDELVIAIQNALSMQEVRDLNETLQQRIDEATRELRASNAQLRKLDEAKDEFISMASHQLRTPLTSIKGYIDMMLEGDAGKITPVQRKFLTEAFVSSDRMVHLINDFLNISRLQTGKFTIEKRPVDLAKVVTQELESLKISATGRDLKFAFKPAKNLPHLMLDESKIRQVIMNFADNALYYSPAGSVIDVTLELSGDRVELKIKDQGIGVPKSEQARLFTKFFRAANARKQRPDGTGVGLYLAKRVVVGHGGEVIFSSTEGKGSTFGFSLPLKRLRVDDNTDQLDNQPDDN